MRESIVRMVGFFLCSLKNVLPVGIIYGMQEIIASIDLGSRRAGLLISRQAVDSRNSSPLFRKRE